MLLFCYFARLARSIWYQVWYLVVDTVVDTMLFDMLIQQYILIPPPPENATETVVQCAVYDMM